MMGSLVCWETTNDMKVVLNEFTGTVHKQKAGAADRHTACGVTRMLAHDNFQMITAELAATEYNTNKCGRCFEGEGGY